MGFCGQHLNSKSVINLSIGIIVGICLSYFFLLQTEDFVSSRRLKSSGIYVPPNAHSHGGFDDMYHGKQTDTALKWGDAEHHHHDDDAVARVMASKVRVFCWTMTGPKNHQSKAVHIKATWAKRCNKHIFLSSQEDKNLDIVRLDVPENRNALWGKTKAAFKHAYKYLDDYDWFLKTDDDSYIVMENLRYMLSSYEPQQPVYFGRRFKPYLSQGYFSGGAGYVLSREALKRFVEKGVGDRHVCRQDDGGAEDVEMGRCMENLKVAAGDSRDHLHRETFHPFMPESHLIPNILPKNFWFWKWSYYPQKEGPDCCSDFAISFHYVPPNQMYVFEYLIYHLKPYGINAMYSLPEKYRDKPKPKLQEKPKEKVRKNETASSEKEQRAKEQKTTVKSKT